MVACKYDSKTHKVIVDAIRDGVTYGAAAGEAGVSARTFHGWLRKGMEGDARFEKLVAEVKAAEAYVERNMTQVIYQAAMGGDWRAAQLYLERRVKEWRPKNDLNIEVELEQMLDVIERELGEREAERIFAVIASGVSASAAEPKQVDSSKVN